MSVTSNPLGAWRSPWDSPFSERARIVLKHRCWTEATYRFVFAPTPSSSRGAPGRGGDENIAYQSDDLVGLKSGSYNMILFRAEWQPGASSPLHEDPGPAIYHLLEGTVAHTDEGVTRTLNAGEFSVTQVGAKVTTKNTGNTKAVALIARLIPQGEAPATFIEPANPLSFR